MTSPVPGWLGRSEPRRTISLGLDGKAYQVTLTRAEEHALRARLQPYVRVARLVHGPSPSEAVDQSQRLSARLREARVHALLGLGGGPTTDVVKPSLEALVDRAAEIYARSLADQTRAAYRRRWARFASWCEQRGLASLPAEAGTVMAYLADQLGAEPRPALSTLRGQVNAISRVHREYDLRPPSGDPALAMLMRGLSRSAPPRAETMPVTALRIEQLRAVCRHLDHADPVIVRDAALLRLALEGFPAGVLARLRWQDVRFDRGGMLLGERQAKNGAVVTWREVPARADTARCPVAALQRWRAMAGTSPPLVFTIVDHDGHRSPRSLRPSGIRAVLGSRLDSLGRGSPEDLAAAADLLHEVPADVLRDRAILLLGFGMAARRGELTDLCWGDVRTVDEGLVVTIRRSKTDLAGRGATVGIPWGHSLLTCPVRAVAAWRERVQQQLGADCTPDTPVFVRVGRAGRITAAEPLTREAITTVVRRRMRAAGIDGRWGGRSLRAGLISSAADLDIALDCIARQSRHASLDSLVRYVRTQDVWSRNAVDRIGM